MLLVVELLTSRSVTMRHETNYTLLAVGTHLLCHNFQMRSHFIFTQLQDSKTTVNNNNIV